jgi:hypothetical protein
MQGRANGADRSYQQVPCLLNTSAQENFQRVVVLTAVLRFIN